MKVSDYILDSYKQVQLFNILACNIPDPSGNSAPAFQKVSDESVGNQIKFIREELKETEDEFAANNPVGILDGACDLFVTVSGLLQKLEAQGYDVGEAMRRVDDNNLSKFPKNLSERENEQIFLNPHPTLDVRINQTFRRWAIVDRMTGKVKKPDSFKPVVLDDLVPNYPRTPDTSLTAKVTPTFEGCGNYDETVVVG